MYNYKNKRFIAKETGNFLIDVYVDKETGVEYVSTGFGGFRPLYNPDGTLKVSKDFENNNK